MPNFVAPWVNYLAISSMFIYLTRFPFKNALAHTPLAAYPLLGTACALLGGVLVWKLWTTLHTLGANGLQRAFVRLRPAVAQ